MGRAITPLTNTEIKNSKPKERDYTLSDGNGLSLVIKTNSKKNWIFRYLNPITNKRNRTSLGNYPNVTLKQARDKTLEYHNLISGGIDPVQAEREQKEEKRIEQERNTYIIKNVLDGYFTKKTKTHNLKEITVSKDRGRFNNHFINHLPNKGETNILDIDYKLAITTLKKLENDNKLTTLDKVKSILLNLLKYAYSEEYINDNVLIGRLQVYTFIKPKESKNSATFTRKEDIKKLYNDILSYDKNLFSKYLLLLTIHTAQRQGSIITAKWEDINFKKKVWKIPKEFMKGTASATKNHYVPLSDHLIKYLKELKKYTFDNTYLFPNSQIKRTRNKNPHISNNTARSTLRALGYTNQQQTAHGFRAMFKTVCKEHQEEHNLNNEFVERVLAHKIGNNVENAYNRANNIEDMRKILNWWSEYLEGLIDGK